MKITIIITFIILVGSLVAKEVEDPVVGVIRDKGVVKFTEQVIEESKVFKAWFSHAQRSSLIDHIEHLRDQEIKSIDYLQRQQFPDVYLQLIRLRYEQESILLTINATGADGTGIFGLNFGSYPSKLKTIVEKYTQSLPDYEINDELQKGTKNALKESLRDSDFTHFVNYKTSLDKNVEHWPPHMNMPSEEGKAKIVGGLNRLFSKMEVSDTVQYICSKQIFSNHYYSIYQLASDFGPGVFVFHYKDIENKPTLIKFDYSFGTNALIFAPLLKNAERDTINE